MAQEANNASPQNKNEVMLPIKQGITDFLTVTNYILQMTKIEGEMASAFQSNPNFAQNPALFYDSRKNDPSLMAFVEYNNIISSCKIIVSEFLYRENAQQTVVVNWQDFSRLWGWHGKPFIFEYDYFRREFFDAQNNPINPTIPDHPPIASVKSYRVHDEILDCTDAYYIFRREEELSDADIQAMQNQK